MISAAVMCLALNLYHEARGESLAGNLAVGFVTMNRVADPRYPDTVCGVVKQAKYHAWSEFPIRNKCQFSWFCDGLSDKPKDDKAFMESVLLSKHIMASTVTDISEGATHYHATWIQAPYWAGDLSVVLELDQHIFYK